MAHAYDEKNRDVSSCYQEGKRARRIGIELLEGNPYPAPSMFADAWDKGWIDEHDLIYTEYNNAIIPTKDQS